MQSIFFYCTTEPLSGHQGSGEFYNFPGFLVGSDEVIVLEEKSFTSQTFNRNGMKGKYY